MPVMAGIRQIAVSLIVGIVGSAIVAILDRLGLFQWLVGESALLFFSGLLTARIPAFIAVGAVACVFLVGLRLGKGSKRKEEEQQEEPWILPHDQERTLRCVLEAGGEISAHALQEYLGVSDTNFGLLLHELEDAAYLTSNGPDPYRIVYLLDLARTYLAQRTRQVRGRLA